MHFRQLHRVIVLGNQFCFGDPDLHQIWNNDKKKKRHKMTYILGYGCSKYYTMFKLTREDNERIILNL